MLCCREKRKKKQLIVQNNKSPLAKAQKEKKTESAAFVKPAAATKTAPTKLSNAVTNGSSLSSSDEDNFKKPFSKMDNPHFVKSEHEKVSVNNEKLLARDQFVKEALASAVATDRQNSSGNLETKVDLGIKIEEGSQSAKESTRDEDTAGPVQLPDNLPLILVAGITNLTDAAANCSNGKCRFFDSSVNKTLLG